MSDASWADGCARLCWLVFHPAAAPWGCVSEIPCTFLSRCVPRDTQICMAELLAAVLPLWLSPSLFLGTAVSIFMDNVAALCALVNGGSKAWDLSHMSLAFHALLCRLRAVSWIEYVGSQSNAAGTRAGMANVVARELRVPLRQVPFPAWFSPKIALHRMGFDGSCVAHHSGSNGGHLRSHLHPCNNRLSLRCFPPVP